MARLYAHADGYVLLRYEPGPRTLADVQAVLAQTGQALRAYGWKMLSDHRLLTPFTPDEQALIVAYWQSHAAEVGPVTGAVLLSENVFSRLSFDAIKHQANDVLHYHAFANEAEAAAWLRQQP